MNINHQKNGLRFVDILIILVIVFTALKLTNVISWSWFYVLSPIILWLVLLFVLVILTLVVGGKHECNHYNPPIPIDLRLYKQECLDAFRMDCTKQELKESKEAQKTFKVIKRHNKTIDKINRLITYLNQ